MKMNGHVLFISDDFEGMSYEELENNKTYDLVVAGGLSICKNCGEYEAGLDNPCKAIKVGESYDFLFEGKNNDYDEEYKDYICGEKTENTEENKVTEIDNILAKYENFYKGGSGYTFKIEVDDFNEIVKHIEAQQEKIKKLALQIEFDVHMNRQQDILIQEQHKEIEGLRIVLEAERGFIQNREDSCEDYGYEVFIEGKKRYFTAIDEVVDHIKSSVYFEVDGQDLRKNLGFLRKKEEWLLNEDVWVTRL
jgi:hypothetical protein